MQTQLGTLLEQLQSENPESKAVSRFSNQVLSIALSLDKLVNDLSNFYSSLPPDGHGLSNVEDFSQPQEGEVEERPSPGKDFNSAELHNYTTTKSYRQRGKKNFLGVGANFPNIGSACTNMAWSLDQFMSYKTYGICPDDSTFPRGSWLRGWGLPKNESVSSEFTVDEVLGLKPGEFRIGLDFSPTTGTFAAIMRDRNVTIASPTLNLGPPFNVVIALRGFLPLYITIASRSPFFDNTLDIVHSNLAGLIEIYSRHKKLLRRVAPKVDKLGNELFPSATLEDQLEFSSIRVLKVCCYPLRNGHNIMETVTMGQAYPLRG
ncbi:hypothetical protein RJ641_006665, partial [Dillenia turbinata]